MDDLGGVLKLALVLLVVFVAWQWVRNGVSASIGPGLRNPFDFGGPDTFASGYIPMGRGGLTFGTNVPWNW